MTEKKNKIIGALFLGAFLFGAVFCPILADTIVNEQQVVISYSLVPSLLLLNIVTPLEVPSDNTATITVMPSILNAYRISARD